jgi:tetratricopeptide (TPR) repeat protein
MVALQPDSMKYRMEKQYSQFNLGVLLWDQRRFAEAAAQFRNALGTIEAIAAADAANLDYQQSVADSLPWLGDADRAIGDYRDAIDARVRQVALLEQLFAKSRDVGDEMKLVDAKRALARYYAEQGQTDAAIAQLRAAVAEAAILIPKEPQNALWVESGYTAQLSLARQLLVSRKTDEAAAQIASACDSVQRLLKRNSRNTDWRVGLGSCLTLQAQIALARGDRARALQQAQAALAVTKSTHTADAAADAYLTSAAYQQVGDVERELGDSAAATAAWQAAFAALPSGVAETPSELNQRAELLQRLGRNAEAMQLMNHLRSLGYRSTSS